MHSAVSADFDPYHKWLGIPPAEQPPHHYRLLGVVLFESDPEVIAAAADRQMAHVKSFAAGRYAVESQSLLNELARVRVTLLNAQQRIVYDRGLQRQLASRGEATTDQFQEHPDQSIAQPVEPTSHESADLQRLARLRSQTPRTAYIARQRRNGSPALMTAIVVGLIAIAASLYYAAATRPTDASRASKAPSVTVPSVDKRPEPVSGLTSDNARPRSAHPDGNRDEPLQSARSQPMTNAEPPHNAPAQRDTAQPRLAAPPAKPAVRHAIDLDLKKPRQRHIIKDATHTQFRVASLRDCTAPYTIKPKDGTLDAANRVTIVVHGVRDANIRMELIKSPQGTTSILFEFVITNDVGEEVAFTLPYLERVRRQITREGQQASSLLGTMTAEKTRLQAWIDAPVAKPLAERGQARARVAELGIAIPEQSSFVDALSENLVVADRLFDLATHLHDDCAIEIEVVE